jgi:hypothetical protein
MYTIHKRPGGNGRPPRYVMRKTEAGGLPTLPEGYEIRENVHGQVSIRRKREPVLHQAEERLLRDAVNRHHAAGYALQIDGSAATVFASALGGVSRARITQIMNLRLLAPHIQEKILFHERVHSAKDTVKLRDLQAVAMEADWRRQKKSQYIKIWFSNL